MDESLSLTAAPLQGHMPIRVSASFGGWTGIRIGIRFWSSVSIRLKDDTSSNVSEHGEDYANGNGNDGNGDTDATVCELTA